MTYQDQFVNEIFDGAVRIEQKYGIPHTVLIAQAALETGYGKSMPPGECNAYFGIKAGSSWGGTRILITTTEYHNTNTGIDYPSVISISEHKPGVWKWKVKDYFRCYESKSESLEDYAKLLTKNKHYKEALKFKHNPDLFIEQLTAYATDPNYIQLLKQVRQGVLNRINKYNLKKKVAVGGVGLIFLALIAYYVFLRK